MRLVFATISANQRRFRVVVMVSMLNPKEASTKRKFSSYLSHLWFDCGSFYDLII